MSPAVPAPPKGLRKERLRVVFIDVVRLLALAQMVNGHTLDAVMVDSIRTSEWFPTYDYLRGLVSVAFLVAAGLAYHLTTFLQFDPVRAANGRKKRVLRSFFLIAVGYTLRLGPNLFSDDPVLRQTAIEYLLRIDVLHTVGFSILCLELITARSKTAEQARLAAFGLAVVMLVLAPITSRIPLTDANRIWLGWLTHEGQSYFPIAPWAAYPLLGAALGAFIAPAGADTHKGPLRLLGTAAALYAFSLALRAAFPSIGVGIHPASDPGFFLEKLAALLVLAAPIAFLVRNVPALPRPLEVLTGETLVVYVFHLLAIFAPIVGPGRAFRHALELGPAFGVAAVMLVLSFGVGLAAPQIRKYVRRLVSPPAARPDVAEAAS